jgi:type IV pilus assembly protein PilE
VAIVAILTAIAYPSYQRYVARTHRNAATACMSHYAQWMERYYTTNLNYNGPNSTPSLACRLENDLNRRYTVQLRPDSNTQSAYTIEAVPTQLQAGQDPNQCGTLSLTNTGRRTPANNECWR